MPLSDYVKEDKEFSTLPADEYIVSLDDCTCDTTALKPYVDAKFKVQSGDHTGRFLFKRFYITEGTLGKFIPWQFGIMGIWDEVKNADSFSEGTMKAVEAMADIIGNTYKVSVEVSTYTNKKGEVKERNDLVIMEEYLDAIKDTKPIKPKTSSPPEINTEEEIPF